MRRSRKAGRVVRTRRKTELIVSEDGLMLNTGIFFTRVSAWSWRFFQKVRRFTFGPRAPVTQHPWWEQTAMVYRSLQDFSRELFLQRLLY